MTKAIALQWDVPSVFPNVSDPKYGTNFPLSPVLHTARSLHWQLCRSKQGKAEGWRCWKGPMSLISLILLQRLHSQSKLGFLQLLPFTPLSYPGGGAQWITLVSPRGRLVVAGFQVTS